jgi:hypothetical protein
MDDTFSTFAARPENHDPAEVFQEGGGDRGVNHRLIPPGYRFAGGAFGRRRIYFTYPDGRRGWVATGRFLEADNIGFDPADICGDASPDTPRRVDGSLSAPSYPEATPQAQKHRTSGKPLQNTNSMGYPPSALPSAAPG